MTTHKPPRCPECAADVRLVDRDFVHRRGDRSITVRGQLWECVAPDAHGGETYRFADAALMQANDATARAAWRERYGEEIPAGRVPRARRQAEPAAGGPIGWESRDATGDTVDLGARQQRPWSPPPSGESTLTVAV